MNFKYGVEFSQGTDYSLATFKYLKHESETRLSSYSLQKECYQQSLLPCIASVSITKKKKSEKTRQIMIFPISSHLQHTQYSYLPILYWLYCAVPQVSPCFEVSSFSSWKTTDFLCFLMMRSYLLPLVPLSLWQLLICALSSQCMNQC